MQKRPSSRTRGSARVDAILRYRNAREGVLCSSRCRELSRYGLTATMDRPVYPGELLRIDLEPPSGGPSVLGLARVAWIGSDADSAPGTSIMRMRFVSLGEASEAALFAWLDELTAVAERPSSPHDDSSVRALSRAIADSLLPPPPVLPGAVPSDESSGLSPVPIAVPNRPLIPPPPGMYARSTHTLSHPIDCVGPAAHESRALPKSPTVPRTAEVRDRLSRLQRRRDQTPLVVPLDARRPIETAPVETPPADPVPPPIQAPSLSRTDAPSLALSDAPWSVPASPPDRPWLAPRWVALGLASLTLGAALAYVVYGPMFLHRAQQPQAAAARVEEPAARAQSAADALEHDRMLAADMALPARPRGDVMNAPEGSSDAAGPTAREARNAPSGSLTELMYPGALEPQHPKLAAAATAAKPPTPRAPVMARPLAAAPKAHPAPEPGDALTPAPAARRLPPPPALPAALAAPAAVSVAARAAAPTASKLDRARACLARGDNDCAAKLLKGASTESELELWIEMLRAQGRAIEARHDMQRFVDTYPEARRAAVYQRILSNAP